MTPTLLVLVPLSQTGQVDATSTEAVPRPHPAYSTEGWRYLIRLEATGLALGLGQPGARHVYSGQVRWRFRGKLYALAEGGTLLFPKADGALRPGAYASVGLGVDNAR